MLKALNLLIITLFIFVASITPYSSVKGATTAFSDNSEERDLSSQAYEDELLHQEAPVFFMKTIVKEIFYPIYITLRPQTDFVDILKPPLA